MTEKPQEAGDRPDRRVNTRLRQIFDEGLTLIEPFFDPDKAWGGNSLEYLAFRVMRENYPELSQDEVRTFVMAAKRVYGEKHSADRQ